MNLSDLLSPAFRALSARLGQDPLQVQGPGGNTSIKSAGAMWIKASGTELANAETTDIFVAVDRDKAVFEAREQAGDGSCKDTVLDPSITLRPSIETTFHAAFDWAVVAHTHSVATLVHAISAEGRIELGRKLSGLPFVCVPYAKPGLPLTRQILARIKPDTQVVVLQNHGLICCANSVEDVSDLIAQVETRLSMPTLNPAMRAPTMPAPDGFIWSDHSWLGQNTGATDRALGGTYYPDHVVFMGPALPTKYTDEAPPAILLQDQGVLIRNSATPSQKAMLKCLSDVLSRVPEDWSLYPIGPEAEAELLNWDAEKYRQALAERR